jgi:hypothetical protein
MKKILAILSLVVSLGVSLFAENNEIEKKAFNALINSLDIEYIQELKNQPELKQCYVKNMNLFLTDKMKQELAKATKAGSGFEEYKTFIIDLNDVVLDKCIETVYHDGVFYKYKNRVLSKKMYDSIYVEMVSDCMEPGDLKKETCECYASKTIKFLPDTGVGVLTASDEWYENKMAFIGNYCEMIHEENGSLKKYK